MHEFSTKWSRPCYACKTTTQARIRLKKRFQSQWLTRLCTSKWHITLASTLSGQRPCRQGKWPSLGIEWMRTTAWGFSNKIGHGPLCQQVATQNGNKKTKYIVGKSEPFFRKESIHGGIQVPVPTALCKQLLYCSHYPELAGQSCQRRMHDWMCETFLCGNMVINVYSTVSSCDAYKIVRITLISFISLNYTQPGVWIVGIFAYWKLNVVSYIVLEFCTKWLRPWHGCNPTAQVRLRLMKKYRS